MQAVHVRKALRDSRTGAARRGGRVLYEVGAALSQGFTITLAPPQTVLSTSEAAHLQGVAAHAGATAGIRGVPVRQSGTPKHGPARRSAGLPAAVPPLTSGDAGSDGRRS